MGPDGDAPGMAVMGSPKGGTFTETEASEWTGVGAETGVCIWAIMVSRKRRRLRKSGGVGAVKIGLLIGTDDNEIAGSKGSRSAAVRTAVRSKGTPAPLRNMCK